MSSSHMTAIFVKRFEERAKKELKEVDKRLAEFKREIYEELTAGCPAEGGVNSDRSLFEFACYDHKVLGRRQERGIV